MKFVLAPDSFKQSMTALEVAESMEKGIKKIFPDSEFVKVPVADGGEGTVQSLVDATNGKIIKTMVVGPLGNKVQAEFGLLGDTMTAVIEMASASGINHTTAANRNPMIATTYGTGELIKKALDLNVKKIILGIGGSATNDGGQGMALALGVKFLDKDGEPVPMGGGQLDRIEKIDISNIDPRVHDVEFMLASDVVNVLTGEHGASHVFGPQKGATPEMISQLDHNLAHYAQKIKQFLNIDVANIPGSGAAGGLGAGLIAFVGAKFNRGVDIIIDYTKLKEKVKGADFVFTGEGGIDFQTKFGKTPYGVAKAVKEVDSKIPVIALAGYVGDNIESLYDGNIDAIFGILRGATTIDEALKEGQKNVVISAENIARLIKTTLSKPIINEDALN